MLLFHLIYYNISLQVSPMAAIVENKSSQTENKKNVNWEKLLKEGKVFFATILSKIMILGLYLLERICYYGPIMKTKFIEFTTFTIQIQDHFSPINISKNDYVFITSSSAGSQGRHLINIFYKRYSPYDIRDFTVLMEKYLQVNSIKFNLIKFSNIDQTIINDNSKKYTIEFFADGTIKINNKPVEITLYSVDLKTILAENHTQLDNSIEMKDK